MGGSKTGVTWPEDYISGQVGTTARTLAQAKKLIEGLKEFI